jgi:hypothetical protein
MEAKENSFQQSSLVNLEYAAYRHQRKLRGLAIKFYGVDWALRTDALRLQPSELKH